MQQSTVVVGGIILAFIAWVILRNRLPLYLADLGVGQSSTAPATTTGDATTAAQQPGGSSAGGASGFLGGIFGSDPLGSAVKGAVGSFNLPLFSDSGSTVPAVKTLDTDFGLGTWSALA